MATIDVKISQALLDSAALTGLAHEDGVFDTAMDAMASALAKIPTGAAVFTSATMTDGTVKVTYADGTYQVFTGVKMADANATQGTATATGMTLVTPGAVSVQETGTFTFNYTTQPTLSIHAASAVADSITVKTMYAATSPDYNAVYGNVSADLQGHLTVGVDGRVEGSFTSLKVTADKLLASASIDGHFHIGDSIAMQPDDAAGGPPVSMPTAATDNANVTVPASDHATDTSQPPATMPTAATDNANVTVPASDHATDTGQPPSTMPTAATDNANVTVPASDHATDTSQPPATMPTAATDNANVTVPASDHATDTSQPPATMPVAATDNANVTVPATDHITAADHVIASPAGDVTIDGNATAMDLEFRDGSYVRASDLGVMFNSGQLDGMLGLVHGALSGNDTIKVDLPATLANTFVVASGAGDDTVSVAGGGGKLDVAAGAGDDIVTILSGHHHVDGGAGTDTVVFTGAKADYTVTHTATGLEVASGGGVDVLTNVERLQFSDGAVAYDVDGNGNAGEAWRMYKAAFDRAPDGPGLGYWIKQLDHHVTLRDLADSFIKSTEFAQLYGDNPSDAAFVARLYNNVLHRDYDQAGFNYWVDVLSHGEARANVLVNFSEGAENRAQVVGSIQHGADYTPFG